MIIPLWNNILGKQECGSLSCTLAASVYPPARYITFSTIVCDWSEENHCRCTHTGSADGPGWGYPCKMHQTFRSVDGTGTA